MNWTGVSFASASITRVTNVSFNQAGSLLDFSGDVDQYPTVIAKQSSKPTATVTSGDEAALLTIGVGTVGTLAATHNDATMQTGGAIVFAMINAVSQGAQAGGAWGQFGSSSITFRSYSSDGSTNPLSFTRV